MHSPPSRRALRAALAGMVCAGFAVVTPGCGQELFLCDAGQCSGDAGGDAGPPVIAFSASSGFAAEGVSGPTWNSELRVRLAWADSVAVPVQITSSHPEALSVADGGAWLIPAGQTEAPVVVTGHSAAAWVWLTAQRAGTAVDAGVRVIGAGEQPRLVSLTPDGGTLTAGDTIDFQFALEFPSPAPVTVAIAVDPASLGEAPATVTVPARTLDGGFVFTASAAGSGTLSVTAANTLSTQLVVRGSVVISELAGESLADNNDEFVELYNPTDAEISLAGWRLDYRSSSGSISPYHAFGGSAAIAPRGYFLVGHPTAFSGVPDEDLRKSDGTPQSGVTMSAASGSMLLMNSLGSEVDRVGWGTGEAETSPADEAIDDASIERKANAASTVMSMTTGADVAAGNGHDTNHNREDFIVRPTRDPQRSTAPQEP